MFFLMIIFNKTIKYDKILNPLKDFKEDTLTFEYRTDPLTGRNTTVIKGMYDYIRRFLISDEELVNSLAAKTRLNCPFCPENIKEKTPMFTSDFIKEGRIFVDDAVVIPNLTGHAERSILVIPSKKHYLKLGEFTPKIILNALKGGSDYLRRLSKIEPSISYPVFIFNYLPPAGSSIFHPHMQVLVRDRPFYLAELLLTKSKGYYQSNKTSFWSDLLAMEKNGKRYLFKTGDVEWIVPFASLRGLNEVQAIVRGRSNLLELEDKEWIGLAEGTARILKFYQKEEYSSFNIILISGPMDNHLDFFNVNLRIISRPGIQSSSFTDAWAVPYLLWDGEAIEEPELFAERIRKSYK